MRQLKMKREKKASPSQNKAQKRRKERRGGKKIISSPSGIYQTEISQLHNISI